MSRHRSLAGALAESRRASLRGDRKCSGYEPDRAHRNTPDLASYYAEPDAQPRRAAQRRSLYPGAAAGELIDRPCAPAPPIWGPKFVRHLTVALRRQVMEAQKDADITAGELRRAKPDRRIGKYLVLLRARLRFVFLIDQLQGAFAQQVPWQDHDADETARTVGGGLREYRVGPAFIPGTAGAMTRRTAIGVDPDTAFYEAADARPLVTMQERAAARRKRDAVATQQQFGFRQRLKRR